MAGGVKIDITASSRKARRELDGFKGFINRWGKRLISAGVNMGQALIGGLIRTIRRGAIVAGGLLTAGIIKSIKTSADFERSEIQLQSLIGTAEGARERMGMLEDLALDVTFDLTSLIAANRHLQVFTDGAMAGRDAMMLIADAASVTPNEIQDVAFWFGRAYAMIDSGRPMGEAVMRLTEMGLMSKEAAGELKKLERSFNPDAQKKKLDVLVASLERFAGSNSLLINTLSGQFSMFRDATTLAFKSIGDAIAPLTKKWLQELISYIKRLRSEGVLDEWGKRISSTLEVARTAIENFYAKLKANAGETGWGMAIADEIENGLDAAGRVIGAWIEENGEAIGAYGAKIGGKIGWGMLKGIAQALKGVPILGVQLKALEKASEFAGRVAGGDVSGAFLGDKTSEEIARIKRESEMYMNKVGRAGRGVDPSVRLDPISRLSAEASFMRGDAGKEVVYLLKGIRENTSIKQGEGGL